MRIPPFGRRPAQRVGATAHSVAQRASQTLAIVRYRTQPAALTIGRLAGTAIFAYLIALVLPFGTTAGLRAPPRAVRRSARATTRLGEAVASASRQG